MVYEPIIVKSDSKGNKAYALGSAVISLICLGLIFVKKHDHFSDTLFFHIIFTVGFLFFLYCSLLHLKVSKYGKNLLVADENGIAGNGVFGVIPWSEIDRVYVDRMFGNEYIEVALKDEKKYINRLSGLNRFLVYTNKIVGHQLVLISLLPTKLSPKNCFRRLRKCRNRPWSGRNKCK